MIDEDSLSNAADDTAREFKWTLMNILAAASCRSFPIDGEGQIVVTITKKPTCTGAIAALECKVAVEMSDTVPQNIRDAIDELFDKGPPAEDLH